MDLWIIFLILGFLAVDLVIVLVIFIKRFRRKKIGDEEMFYIRSHWVRIIDMFYSNAKQAILDADKLLDYALSKQGFKEGTVADKLKKARFKFRDIDDIWTAHKLRNKIAHEFEDVDTQSAKDALFYFKKALNDLGAKL